MKLKNTTKKPDWFLRRMVAWCCKQIGLPPSQIKKAEFGRRSSGCFNGRAWGGGRIRIVIGPASEYPVKAFLYPGRTSDAFLSPDYADQIEGLIGVTAHEVEHVYGYRNGRRKGGERHTRHEERRVLNLFRQNRETLLAEWSESPAAKPKASLQEKRAAKVEKMLATWQRKLKLAQTKVKQYRRKARYYEGATAANRAPAEAPNAR